MLLQPYCETDMEILSITADEINEDSYKKIVKMNGLTAGFLVKGYYISPLLTVANAKDIINLITNNSSNSILWSLEANIEYISTGKNLYNPKMKNATNVNGKSISEYYSNFFSSCILCVTYNQDSCEPTINNTLSNVLRIQLDVLNNNRYVSSFEAKYNNCFKSSFTIDNFNDIQKYADKFDLKSTLFMKLDDKLALLGDVVPIISHSVFGKSYDSFVILISDSHNNIMIYITKEEVIVNNLKCFQDIIGLLIQNKVIKHIPQRIKNDSVFKVELQVNMNTDISTILDLDLYFVNTSNVLMNIISTRDKNISILLGRKSMRITMKNNNQNLAKYIVSLFVAYNIVNEFKIEKFSFGKNVNVYWSRICQNNKKNIRKPAKELVVRNEDKDTIKFEKNDNGEFLYYNDGTYSCTTTVNGVNKHIGFVKKIYELDGLCLPCCFQNPQIESNLFNRCLGKSDIESEITNNVSPFIIESNKSLSDNRIGFLPDEIGKLINKNNTFEIKDKRLVSTKGYYFLYGKSDNYIIESSTDIITYVTDHPDVALVVGNKIYFTPNITNIKFIECVVKEIIYQVKLVKLDSGSSIQVLDLDDKILKTITELRPNILMDTTNNIRTNQFILIDHVYLTEIGFNVLLVENSIDVILDTIMFNKKNLS